MSLENMVVIDVREQDEFRKEKVPSSIHLPLSQLELVAPGILKPLQQCSLLILCRSGGRATLAFDKLKSLGLIDPSRAQVFSGGILEWKRQGRPTEGSGSGTLPLMRQVQVVAGGLAFIGSALSIWGNPQWAYLSLFVGAGLMVAGATGFCGMALLLQKMPWNRVQAPASPSCARQS
ncbi:MAG: hypothetical protein RJB38_321 [Pseudomonadota bacterium]|jgi:rhodanese-related sulfurtransferase